MIERVLQFVRANVYNERKDGKCRELVLQHLGVKGGSRVCNWELEPHHNSADGTLALAEEIEIQAMSDAAGIGGVQSYELRAYHGENEKSSARCRFKMDGSSEDDESEESLNSEPPTPKGLTTQLMRHNEVLMKASMVGVQQIMQTMQRQMSHQASRIETMENDRIKSLDVFEKLMTSQHERELETRKVENRETLTRELLGKVQLLLPVVANKIAGKEIMPTPFKEGLAAFFESMDMTQQQSFGTFVQTLSPEQQAVLQEMMSIARSN